MTERIRFESRRVGDIELDEANVLVFDPLPGFPGRSRFVVVEHSPGSALAWLASIEDPDLAFVVTSPWAFFPDYDPPVEREHLAGLAIEKREELEMLAMVTLKDGEIFVNLASPLLVNGATRRGMQILSDDTRYASRTPLPALRSEEAVPAAEIPGDAAQAPSDASVAPSPR